MEGVVNLEWHGQHYLSNGTWCALGWPPRTISRDPQISRLAKSQKIKKLKKTVSNMFLNQIKHINVGFDSRTTLLENFCKSAYIREFLLLLAKFRRI